VSIAELGGEIGKRMSSRKNIAEKRIGRKFKFGETSFGWRILQRGYGVVTLHDVFHIVFDPRTEPNQVWRIRRYPKANQDALVPVSLLNPVNLLVMEDLIDEKVLCF